MRRDREFGRRPNGLGSLATVASSGQHKGSEMKRIAIVAGVAGVLLASLALPAAAHTARAALKDAKDVGSATLTQTPGDVLIFDP
jgi:hypothetical protein